MKREFLQSIQVGEAKLPKEVIDAIMAENGRDIQAAREADVAATTDYVVNIHAAAEHENIFATQFHPEKSGDIGLQILKNFIEL